MAGPPAKGQVRDKNLVHKVLFDAFLTTRYSKAFELSDQTVVVPPLDWPGWASVCEEVGLAAQAEASLGLTVEWAHKQVQEIFWKQLENYQANWDLALRQAKDDQERAALEPLSPLGKADVVLELRDAVCGALPQGLADAPVPGRQPRALAIPVGPSREGEGTRQ